MNPFAASRTLPSGLWSATSQVVTASPQLQHIEVEFPTYPSVSQPFSPPTTPMTPITPMTPHVPGLYMVPTHEQQQQQHVPPPATPRAPPSMPPLQSPQVSMVPTLSHSTWPPEYRLYAMCQHLNSSTQVSENVWWDQFGIEFFHDSAVLSVEIDLGDGMRKYSLARPLLIYYFRCMIEGGADYFHLRLGDMRLFHQQGLQRIECPQAVQEVDYPSRHGYPSKVCCKGQLVIEFTMEEKPRIFSWVFHIVENWELVPNTWPSEQGTVPGNITQRTLFSQLQSLLMSHAGLSNGRGPDPCPATSSHDLLHPNAASSWQQPPSNPLPPDSSHEVLSHSEGSTVLSHLPLPQQPTSLTSASLSTLHSTPSSSSTSPLPPSPSKSLSLTNPTVTSTNNVVTSTASNGVDQKQQQQQAQPQQQQSQPQQQPPQPRHASKKKPSPIMKKFMLVAEEPALFSEDMVHGEDERRITRIDNPPNKSQATPTSSTGSCYDLTPTSSNLIGLGVSNHNGPLAWPNNPARTGPTLTVERAR